MNRDADGFSLPIIPILIVLIIVLTWFFGWIVLVIVAALVALITAATALHDWVTHDWKCRYCNVIKEHLISHSGIDAARIKTTHKETHPTHMLIRVLVDRKLRAMVDIDFNGEILSWDELP